MRKKIFCFAFALCMIACMLPSMAMATTSGTSDDAIVVTIDDEHFPDSKFQKFVKSSFDEDKDSALSVSEIKSATKMCCSSQVGTYKDGGSLKGIEYFTNLKVLECYSCYLTELDLSKLTDLTELGCDGNKLEALDISKNTKLTSLNCKNNKIKTLDLSSNLALTTLDCSQNQLTSLDLDKNTALEYVSCGYNSLSGLKVSANLSLQELYCYRNNIESLDVSKNTTLKNLDFSYNKLTTIDLSNNILLDYIDFRGNNLTSIDVSNCSNAPSTFFSYGNTYTIFPSDEGKYNLSNLKGGFDVSKTSNWSGGTVSGNVLTIDSDAEKVTYTYDCGKDKTAEFTLVVHQHTYGNWISNSNGTHTGNCTTEGCNAYTTESCSGGKATCVAKAVCTKCGASYGELGEHTLSAWTFDPMGGLLECGSHSRKCTTAGCTYTETGDCEPDENKANYKAATCTEKGNTGDTVCKVCGGTMLAGDEEAALGHTGGEATCIAKAVCTRCGQQYGEVNSSNHKNTELRNATTATCTQLAYSGDIYCADCNTCLIEGGHTGTYAHNIEDPEIRNAKAATCKEKGYTGDYYCKLCGGLIAEGTEIETLAHDYANPVIKNARAATCTEKGYEGDYCCKNCGTVIISGREIDALGHEESTNYSYDGTSHWKTCTREGCTAKIDETAHAGGEATCKAQAVCSVCKQPYGEKDSANHTGTETWVTTSTTHKKAYNCCGLITEEAESHQWNNGVCSECGYVCKHTGGTATCKEQAVCSVCNQSYGEKNSANHTGAETWVTTSSTHKKVYSCCGAVTSEEANHTWENGQCSVCHYGCTHDWVDATCTTPKTCSICGATEGNALDHDLVSHEAKAATCTEIGWDAYDTCSRCNYTTYKEIPATGHSYMNGTCTVCGAAESVPSGGGGGGVAVIIPITDNVINTIETKTESTETGTETMKVPTTTATISAETKTNADGTKTTTAAVDSTTATKIIEKAVENKSEEVVVDTSSKAAVTETAAGTKTEVGIPTETVAQISEKTDAAVIIKSDAAEVTLDKEAVAAVAEQAGDEGNVKLIVETVAQEENKVQVELKLESSNGTISDFKDGNVSVTVKLNSALTAKSLICVYIDDNGVYHKVSGQKNADGTYTFITGLFSTYAIIPEEKADEIIASQNEKAASLVKALSFKARSVKTAKGNIKVNLTVSGDEIQAIEDLGYTVKYKFYRSTKKSSSYQAKIEKTGKTYTNTTGKKGTRYYYKARVMAYDSEGTLIAKTALKQCKYATRVR